LTKPDEVMQKGIDKRITANMDNKVNNKRALADCLSGKKWDPKKKNNKNAEQREAEEEELQTKEAKVDKIDTWLGVSDSDMESCLKEHMRENAGGWVPWGATVKGHELTVEGKRWLHVVPGGPLFHHLVEGDAWGKHVFLGFDVKGSGAIEGKGYAPGWGRFDIYGTNPGHLAPTHGETGPVQENGKATGVFHMKIEFWPSGSNKDSQKSVLGLRLGWKGDALTGQATTNPIQCYCWGFYCEPKCTINQEKHFIFSALHPSPYSETSSETYKDFFVGSDAEDAHMTGIRIPENLPLNKVEDVSFTVVGLNRWMQGLSEAEEEQSKKWNGDYPRLPGSHF